MSTQEVSEVHGLQQLYVKRDTDRSILLIMAKVVDDFLLAGTKYAIQNFYRNLAERLEVGRFIFREDLIFNGLQISQDAYFTVSISMQECFQAIQPVVVPPHRKKNMAQNRCTDGELTSFLRRTGSLIYLGHGALPEADFAASHLQQLVGRLTVSDLVTAKKVPNEIQALEPSIRCCSLSDLSIFCYLAFSDASQGKSAYRQTSYISGLYLPPGESLYIT